MTLYSYMQYSKVSDEWVISAIYLICESSTIPGPIQHTLGWS